MIGMYLQLFHGRKNPDDDMEKKYGGWGPDGPIFWIESLNGTYASEIRFSTQDEDDCSLAYFEDLLYYDGMFYGDFRVRFASLSYFAQDNDQLKLVSEYSELKADLPGKYVKAKPMDRRQLCLELNAKLKDFTVSVKDILEEAEDFDMRKAVGALGTMYDEARSDVADQCSLILRGEMPRKDYVESRHVLFTHKDTHFEYDTLTTLVHVCDDGESWIPIEDIYYERNDSNIKDMVRYAGIKEAHLPVLLQAVSDFCTRHFREGNTAEYVVCDTIRQEIKKLRSRHG